MTKSAPLSSVEKYYEKVVASFASDPEVSLGGKVKKGFGASALRVNDKIFAMISSKPAFVVKMPETRVNELAAGKKGRRFEPSKGRVMKEWLELAEGTNRSWAALAREAKQFVAGQK